jgi:hypothetical protein
VGEITIDLLLVNHEIFAAANQVAEIGNERTWRLPKDFPDLSIRSFA